MQNMKKQLQYLHMMIRQQLDDDLRYQIHIFYQFLLILHEELLKLLDGEPIGRVGFVGEEVFDDEGFVDSEDLVFEDWEVLVLDAF